MGLKGDKTNMEIKVGDKFIFHDNGLDFTIYVININYFREPSMRYGLDVYDDKGVYKGDVTFVGDDFFNHNANKLDKLN